MYQNVYRLRKAVNQTDQTDGRKAKSRLSAKALRWTVATSSNFVLSAYTLAVAYVDVLQQVGLAASFTALAAKHLVATIKAVALNNATVLPHSGGLLHTLCIPWCGLRAVSKVFTFCQRNNPAQHRDPLF
eukprot:407357-Pleurochrysis_carterae.AAC.6